MPELPEVEVVRRQLEPLLVGRTVAEVEAGRASYFFLTHPRELRRRLPGRRFEALTRTGKYLVARLDSGERLLLHLGMTGQILSAPSSQRHSPPRGHTHLRLRFADGGPGVLFRDVRKFGKVQLLAERAPSPRLDRLGVDALNVRAAHLHSGTRGRRSAVKSLLLDQAVLAGVGNIYADEALFLAGIRPRRPAGRLALDDCRRLAAAVRRVLRRAIRRGGSSISDYVRPDGTGGESQEEHRVYGRTGEPCTRCRTPIRRVVIGQRSAHFCPRCQR